MTIKKIDIKSFGQLKNLTLEFSNNVNIIEGQNEAGKSTIAAFIKYMLYGFEATEPQGSVGERRKRINWDTGIAEGSMIITVDKKDYFINRSTVLVENNGRTTYKEESSIIDMESGTTAFGKLPAGEVFFGVERELFENTAFIGQVGDTSIKAETVKDAIENILFSGNEQINTQRAANQISDKMEALLHTGNTGGAIYDLIRQQEELEAKLRSTDEDNKKILAKEAELHEIREKREAAEAKREKLLDLEDCYRNVMLIHSFDELHKVEEECDKSTEIYNNYLLENTKNGFVPSSDYLTEIALGRQKVNDTFRRQNEAQAEYTNQKNAIGITKEIEGAIELSDEFGGEEAIKSTVKETKKSSLGYLFGAIGAFVAALAGGIFEIAGAAFPASIKILVGILAALALVGSATLAFFYYKEQKKLLALANKFNTKTTDELCKKIAIIEEARGKRDNMISSADTARKNLEAARLEYETARGELTRIILRWGEQPPMSDLNAFLDELVERVEAFLERKNELLEEKNTLEITVKEIRRNLADKNEVVIRAQVLPFKRKVLSEVNHDEITSGIAEAKLVIEENQRLAANVENELSILKMRATDPGELYSKIQALESRIEALKVKHKAYFVALRAISTASESLRQEISPRLGEYATDLMKTMTESKYKDLKVSDGLGVNFTAPGGKELSAEYLSGGTKDLTYVAVRLALVDMLYTEKPPICFDETFANQDNRRATAMMKAIKNLAKDGYQSFIFTCRAREGTIATEQMKKVGIYKLSVIED